MVFPKEHTFRVPYDIQRLSRGSSMVLIDTNELRYWPALYESPELRDDASAHEDCWSRSLIAKLQRPQLKTLFLAWRATHLLFTWTWEGDRLTTAQLAQLYRLKWLLWCLIEALWTDISNVQRPESPCLAHSRPFKKATK